ncbi:MAG TPA: hypothetical protein VIP46_13570 [Pyrinomonadaceae bacterium]
MKYLLALLTALLTLAAAAVVLRALWSLGAGGVGVVVGGVSEKLLGLLFVLSVIFIILLVIHRRRERHKRT